MHVLFSLPLFTRSEPPKGQYIISHAFSMGEVFSQVGCMAYDSTRNTLLMGGCALSGQPLVSQWRLLADAPHYARLDEASVCAVHAWVECSRFVCCLRRSRCSDHFRELERAPLLTAPHAMPRHNPHAAYCA